MVKKKDSPLDELAEVYFPKIRRLNVKNDCILDELRVKNKVKLIIAITMYNETFSEL